MPTIQSIHWGFTLNFDEGYMPVLDFSSKVQYAIWQHEKVSHNHLQGYIQFVDKHTSAKTVKEEFGELKPHINKLVVNKSGRKPWEYASKDETRVAGPWEFGIRIEKGSNKRSKIEACERSPERMSIEETDLFRTWQASKKMKLFKELYKSPTLDRTWQLELTELLSVPADSRTVIWVYGPDGAEGKTTYAKQLVQKDYAYIDPNQYKDMFEMYHQQGTEKNIVCDFHRSCDVDHFYGFLEKVKNRVIPKIKYRSSVHIELNDIHVVVMANVRPNPDKISMDRIKIVYCNKHDSWN